MALSIGFGNSISLLPAIQATRLLTFASVGLPPTEHTCFFLVALPYGEFSPVRLQTNFQTSDLRNDGTRLSAVHIRLPASLIRWLSFSTRQYSSDPKAVRCRGALRKKPWTESCDSIGRDDSQTPRVRPEALGSPEGELAAASFFLDHSAATQDPAPVTSRKAATD